MMGKSLKCMIIDVTYKAIHEVLESLSSSSVSSSLVKSEVGGGEPEDV